MSPPDRESAADLPVHFFTIVLNGEPFIRYHVEAFSKLSFRWHWHIVEGVASLVHDTAWSVAGGGRVDASLHDHGLSNDGTSAYLDSVARAYPDNITLYRKPRGEFWDGKREMVAAPLANVREECLLWQVDSDELWTAQQITTMRDAFVIEPERTAAMFWCAYFVAPAAMISTRYNYAQNPNQEWRRLWRFRPGDHWAAHEPPILQRRVEGKLVDVAVIAPFTHEETEALGAKFQHFAYVTPAQMKFKETYYGYRFDWDRWRGLSGDIAKRGPVFLRDYFPWVSDETMVDAAECLGVTPIAVLDGETWRFDAPDAAPVRASRMDIARPRIVVDGAFFQHNQRSGIARVWRALLNEWKASGFYKHVLVLDRAGTAPRIAGWSYRSIAPWDEMRSGADAFMLQRVCDEEDADLFISSYYTSPIRTPTVFLAHDFIPERLEAAVTDPNYVEKGLGIEHAAAVICVSEATRKDLFRFFPNVDRARACVIPNAVDEMFSPRDAEAQRKFCEKYRLSRPYFLMVGDRMGLKGYKNGDLFFRALRQWPRHREFDVLCVGGHKLEPDLESLALGLSVHRIDLSDEDLCAAYSAAQALVYPSRLEGFGLPVLEAMACGCPVIAARADALVEVGGDAAFYFDIGDAEDLRAAIDSQFDPVQREAKIIAGKAHAASFTWKRSAALYAEAFQVIAKQLKSGAIAPPPRLWEVLRAEQKRSQAVLAEAVRRRPLEKEDTMNSWLARGPLRTAMFAARARLLRVLPTSAVPTARRVWRGMMGIKLGAKSEEP